MVYTGFQRCHVETGIIRKDYFDAEFKEALLVYPVIIFWSLFLMTYHCQLNFVSIFAKRKYVAKCIDVKMWYLQAFCIIRLFLFHLCIHVRQQVNASFFILYVYLCCA